MSSFWLVRGAGGTLHISYCPRVGRSMALRTQSESEIAGGSLEGPWVLGDHAGNKRGAELQPDAGREGGVGSGEQNGWGLGEGGVFNRANHGASGFSSWRTFGLGVTGPQDSSSSP